MSDPLAQAERDGRNAWAAVAAGVWVIRYYQPHVIAEAVDWRSYRRSCHAYIEEHADETPQIPVPSSAAASYEVWAERAGVDVVFL